MSEKIQQNHTLRLSLCPTTVVVWVDIYTGPDEDKHKDCHSVSKKLNINNVTCHVSPNILNHNKKHHSF